MEGQKWLNKTTHHMDVRHDRFYEISTECGCSKDTAVAAAGRGPGCCAQGDEAAVAHVDSMAVVSTAKAPIGIANLESIKPNVMAVAQIDAGISPFYYHGARRARTVRLSQVNNGSGGSTRELPLTRFRETEQPGCNPCKTPLTRSRCHHVGSRSRERGGQDNCVRS